MIVKNGYIIVEKGDTLSGIASQLGKSIRELTALNPSIKSPDRIFAGQKLKTATRLKKPEKQDVSANEALGESVTRLSKQEQILQAIAQVPREPVSTTENATCCCRLERLQIVQPKRGADSEGRGGSTFTMDVVKLQEHKNIAKPTDKEKGIFELYITAPPFKSGGSPDTKSLSFPHAFYKPKCDLHISLKSEHMDKIAKDEIEINSYALIDGAMDRRAREHRDGYGSEWNITRLLKLATAQEGFYEVYDVVSVGSSKCPKSPLAKIYVAKAMKLDGEAKLEYTGEYDVRNTGVFSEWEAKEKAKAEGKLTLTFLNDTYEFSSAYTTGMRVPKGGRGTLHTVPAKELFGNFAKWFDPVYAIARFAKEVPTSVSEAKAKLKGKPGNRNASSTPGATTLSLKAADFQYTEKPNDYTLAPTGSLELGITVFDGSEIRIDMIPAITKSLDALNEVVSVATNRTVQGEIKADLILHGSIRGACRLEAKADTLKADKSATIGGEVTALIEAKIEAEAKWLYFHVKAGAHAALASEKSIDVGAGIKGEMSFAPPKNPNDPVDFSGDILCTGAAVYLGVYAEIKDDDDAKAGADKAGESEDIYNSLATEQSTQDTSSKESALKVERNCDFKILHEFSFKDVLLNDTPAPALAQYPNHGVPVEVIDDMLIDAQGNIVGAMDAHATMPAMDRAAFRSEG